MQSVVDPIIEFTFDCIDSLRCQDIRIVGQSLKFSLLCIQIFWKCCDNVLLPVLSHSIGEIHVFLRMSQNTSQINDEYIVTDGLTVLCLLMVTASASDKRHCAELRLCSDCHASLRECHWCENKCSSEACPGESSVCINFQLPKVWIKLA